jgi:glycosyltransferase involved in cell wall biosynthesis
MKILLVGEYSRLHNSLKEGLEKLGHQVILVGKQDGFKKYPIEIRVKSFLPNNKYLNYIFQAIYKIFRINIYALENALMWYLQLRKLKGFDVVQIYNESIAKTYTNLEIKLFNVLKKNNKSIFLLSCGIDYISVNYAFTKKFRYSILSPYLENPELKKEFRFILNKLKPSSKRLSDYITNNVNGVIASDMDYHLPLKNHTKYLGLAPNPINTDLIQYQPLDVNKKIIIFHGINSSAYVKKGNIYFDKALKIIEKEYPNKVEIITSRDLPYSNYIQHYKNCHILLDQVYAYDQGYNALEAMARGKVVFTGAETEWLEHYDLHEDEIAINALPNENSIAKKLEWLIQNPEKILEISSAARKFIEKEHDYILASKKYINMWSKAL